VNPARTVRTVLKVLLASLEKRAKLVQPARLEHKDRRVLKVR
jgi:hypothetical protein